MNDEQAELVKDAVLNLAVALRDEGPDGVQVALQEAIDAAGGDAAAALTVAACLIHVDLPVDRWWERGLDGVGVPQRPELTVVAS